MYIKIQRAPIIRGGWAARELPINWISSDDIVKRDFLYLLIYCLIEVIIKSIKSLKQ